MTAAPVPPPAEERRQTNVRLPVSLIAEIDARRAQVRNPDKTTGISRDKWIERAARYALDQTTHAAQTAPGRRTAR